MDNVDVLLDQLPVDKLIKSVEELTGMGWGGFVFTLVLTAAVVVLKVWWDRNKKKIRQGRTEYERNQERANTGKENESIEAGASSGERAIDNARRVARPGSPEAIRGDTEDIFDSETGGTRIDIKTLPESKPRPKRPQ